MKILNLNYFIILEQGSGSLLTREEPVKNREKRANGLGDRQDARQYPRVGQL
jgi:hypothetical protein